MKFIHLADLHLGKSLHGISLLDSGDQPHWVEAFLALAGEQQPDAVLMAGDVYDRAAPAAEAVALLDRLLTGLTGRGIPVLLAPGNHDSPRRLAFGRELLARQGLHIAPPLEAPGQLSRVTLEDAYGPVDFWLMPYVFPALAGEALGGEFRDYDSAVRALLEAQDVDFSRRNVLIAHQNVTKGGLEGDRGGSESMVGGVGQVDCTAFDGFDYVALGHIHAGYAVGRPEVRYAGSPLCYHFNETRQAPKGPLLVELGPKGVAPEITLLPLEPLHRLRALEGDYDPIREALSQSPGQEYFSVTLTDRRISPELSDDLHGLCAARGSLLMELRSLYRPEGQGEVQAPGDSGEKRLPELFRDFYAARTGAEPSEQEQALLEAAAELMNGADLSREPEEGQIDRLLALAKKEAAK
ncbi:MAG: exonuclease SbcCD subunit D [Oscillospiraceae bacterium]|nr:exonuclease SbcCD subunit D [Oscillospiraceae bacterium]